MDSRRLLRFSASVSLALAIACSAGCGRKAETPAPAGDQQAGPAPALQPETGANEQVWLVARGKEEYRSCGMCHCETDPKIEWDEDWVKLNEETTCIGGGEPQPEVRKSIMAYLRHPDTLRPVLVGKGYKPIAGLGTGKITLPPLSGSAFLKASRESIGRGTPAMVRLFWDKTDAEKSMAAPAGEYTVINYWLYRRAGKDGSERWSASVTNVDGCQDLAIADGTECVFNTDPLLRVYFTAEKTDSGVTLKFELYDIGGNRTSLTRNGKMVFPEYQIIDQDGNVIDSGRFNVI